MATPLVATFRMTINPAFVGEAHKVRAYVSSISTSAPYDIVQRDGSTITFAAAVQGWWDTIRRAYKATTLGAAITAELEQFVSGSWLPVEFATVTGNGQSVQTGTEYGEQTTVVLRDVLFRKVKIVLLETADEFNNRVTAVTDVNSGEGVAFQCTPGATVVNPPFMWMVGRGNAYLHATAPFVSLVYASNRRVRRSRGIA